MVGIVALVACAEAPAPSSVRKTIVRVSPGVVISDDVYSSLAVDAAQDCRDPAVTLDGLPLTHVKSNFTLAPPDAKRLFDRHPDARTACGLILALPLAWRCTDDGQETLAATDVLAELRPGFLSYVQPPDGFATRQLSPWEEVSLDFRPAPDPATLDAVTLDGAPVELHRASATSFAVTLRAPMSPGPHVLRLPTGAAGLRRFDGACVPDGLFRDRAFVVRDDPPFLLRAPAADAPGSRGLYDLLWDRVGADSYELQERIEPAPGWSIRSATPATGVGFQCEDDLTHVFRVVATLRTGLVVTSTEARVPCSTP